MKKAMSFPWREGRDIASLMTANKPRLMRFRTFRCMLGTVVLHRVASPMHHSIKAIRVFMLSLFVLCARGKANAQHVQEPAYQEKLQHLLSDKTPVIDVPQLAKEHKVMLLDARPAVEYDVSHIAHARRVGYSDFNLSRVKDLPKDTAIVVYCSVGYRSGKITEKLLKAGFINVRNLYGGIFEWVNTGHPVVDDSGKRTDKIHTYNKNWSRWVTTGVKVY